MHRDMKQGLEGKIDGTLHEHQRVFEAWREEFNTERPHAALGGKCPAEVYRKSERKYDTDCDDIEYAPGFIARKVNDRGFFSFKGKRYFAGNPFAGYPVGIHAIRGGLYELWFNAYLISTMNLETGLLEFKTSVMITKAS